ncbi:hypothetical protein IQ265_14185 [Nodosilinea sp. LEGE 06152]|nr:hypothetical protein [Nodosilinea sp. LEGE 06152]
MKLIDVNRAHPVYIEGMEEGYEFNTVTPRKNKPSAIARLFKPTGLS